MSIILQLIYKLSVISSKILEDFFFRKLKRFSFKKKELDFFFFRLKRMSKGLELQEEAESHFRIPRGKGLGKRYAVDGSLDQLGGRLEQ